MKTPLSQFAGRYREWEPAASLRDQLSRLWVNDLSHPPVKTYQVVPDGCVDIFSTGEGLYVAGPDTSPIIEHPSPGLRVSGIRFHPGAAYAWLGLPLAEIVTARVPLAEFWGHEAARIADRVFSSSDSIAAAAALQQELFNRIARAGVPDRRIVFLRRYAAAFPAPSDAARLAELAHRIGVSERTLRRRCIESFGYGFKTLQRILRFQRLFHRAALSARPSLADLAIEVGFADQAHMSSEVQRLCETTPAEFVASFPASWPNCSRLGPHASANVVL